MHSPVLQNGSFIDNYVFESDTISNNNDVTNLNTT